MRVFEEFSHTNGDSRVESPAAVADSYAQHVNPQWVRLLDVLQMNVRYERCQGVELLAADGDRILDFLSGYCVHNAGHNHPKIIAALHHELERCGPAMLQSHVADLAGELAEKLCIRAGGRLNKAFFCSSGSEGVEAVIKFARAHYRKGRFVVLQRRISRTHLRRALADGRFFLGGGLWPTSPGGGTCSVQ